MDTDSLRKYLEFYQDLGIKTLYKQAAPEREIAAPEPVVVAPPAPVAVALPPAVALPVIPELPPMAPEQPALSTPRAADCSLLGSIRLSTVL